MTTENTIIGIDLGTTFSCVSIMQGGKAVVIENTVGARTTPSYVAIEDNDRQVVGSSAKNQATINPNTFYATKRYMGHQFNDDVVKNSLESMHYELKAAKNGDVRAVVKFKDGKEELWAPEKFAAIILGHMKKIAEDYLGHDVKQAVITVPAYFNEKQRQATKDAGKIAGLEVKRIINEPTAAALAYGLDKQQGDRKIAVYDLGGGTFDISIIELTQIDGDHQFAVLSTSGDTFLGGEDFDQKIVDMILADFSKSNPEIDLSQDSQAMQRIKEVAEKCKIALSSSNDYVVNLPYITMASGDKGLAGPKHLNVTITRSSFEHATEDLIERSIKPCQTALNDAGLKINDIDDVILVGGQTRMPKVQDRVAGFFKKAPRKNVNPDEAVAIGAAIQGGVLSGDVKDVLLLDVTPLSLGIETMGGVMTPLIEKNTTIPTRKSQVFSTAADNQTEVTITVLQGERKVASHNKQLGQFNLTNVPPAPRGVPKIEVAFDIDANGILHVTAKDQATNKDQSISIQSAGGLSDEEIEKMMSDAQENAEADKAFEELTQAINQAEQLIHGTKKALKDLGDKVDAAEKEKAEAAIKDLEAAVEAKDKAEIDAKSEALSSISGNIAQAAYQQTQGSESNQANDAEQSETVDAEFDEVDDTK
ncbi:molecular chaperone DnaK [Gammaproteobacteria bacterium]|nr:molecular chaperone DnaK [Gammaproteobacteria bacterium]